MNFLKIWFPDSVLPPFRCVENTTGWPWWAWDKGYHHAARSASRTVARSYPRRFVVNERIFCAGWSDIYYIPRRFFRDFIDLGNIFYEIKTFHEIAIPTMLNIIELTHRPTPFHDVISRLRDCWGYCCADGSTPEDIREQRCGHRMDLANAAITKALVEILEAEAAYLKKSTNRTS